MMRFQDKIRVGFRHRCSRRVGIKVNTDAESRRRCPTHIRIKNTDPPHCCTAYPIIANWISSSATADQLIILLPLGNIDAPGQDTGKHGTITSNIGAGRVLLPGSRHTGTAGLTAEKAMTALKRTAAARFFCLMEIPL